MGVPRFYRWLSERYPKINSTITDLTLMPEFDNCYLDMNGIIHACSHPNDADVSVTITEKDMMTAMFAYIDRIVAHIVRPKKLNQQRSRRFGSAKETADLAKEAADRGEAVDAGSLFDRNCITPARRSWRIAEKLKQFIAAKMASDPTWARLEVVYSGADVPGEGEHKIMQFIRSRRDLDSAEPTRHCMYGNDADLIMLALATHEPYFTLLREVIDFGANKRAGRAAVNARSTVLKQSRSSDFQLLHLSVLREYVQLEFCCSAPASLASHLGDKKASSKSDGAVARVWKNGVATRAWDLERLIDDFVLLTFFVGNDFLPHSPSLDIGEHAFTRIFDAYKRHLATWGEGDDRKREAEREKRRFGKKKKGDDQPERDDDDENAPPAGVASSDRDKYYLRALGVSSHLDALRDADDNGGDGGGGGDEWVATVDPSSKKTYYYNATTRETSWVSRNSAAVVRRLGACFVEGLAWCLAYYVKGCVDWRWFFPCHYCPMLSDVTDVAGALAGAAFEVGRPLRPLEQLMSCLPPLSAQLLPRPHRKLMLEATSPIKEFYPDDFVVDMDGKRNPWEGVNLLPFIEVGRLLEAVAAHCDEGALGADERKRAAFGRSLVFTADPAKVAAPARGGVLGGDDADEGPDASGVSVADEFPGVAEPWLVYGPPLVATLRDACKAAMPGFPSLHALPLVGALLKPLRLDCFGTPSRYETLSIVLPRSEGGDLAPAVAAQLLGKSVFVNWPMTHEARLESSSAAAARPRAARTGALFKVFGKDETLVPLQLAMSSPPHAHVVDERFAETAPVASSGRFGVGSRVLITRGPRRGAVGVVAACDDLRNTVTLDAPREDPEPQFGVGIASALGDKFASQKLAASELGLREDVLEALVGTVVVDDAEAGVTYDVGLRLVVENSTFVALGYVRGAAAARDGGRALSGKLDPKKDFDDDGHLKFANAAHLFGHDGPDDALLDVCKWLAALPTALSRRAVTTRAMSADAVAAVQRAAAKRAAIRSAQNAGEDRLELDAGDVLAERELDAAGVRGARACRSTPRGRRGSASASPRARRRRAGARGGAAGEGAPRRLAAARGQAAAKAPSKLRNNRLARGPDGTTGFAASWSAGRRRAAKKPAKKPKAPAPTPPPPPARAAPPPPAPPPPPATWLAPPPALKAPPRAAANPPPRAAANQVAGQARARAARLARGRVAPEFAGAALSVAAAAAAGADGDPPARRRAAAGRAAGRAGRRARAAAGAAERRVAAAAGLSRSAGRRGAVAARAAAPPAAPAVLAPLPPGAPPPPPPAVLAPLPPGAPPPSAVGVVRVDRRPPRGARGAAPRVARRAAAGAGAHAGAEAAAGAGGGQGRLLLRVRGAARLAAPAPAAGFKYVPMPGAAAKRVPRKPRPAGGPALMLPTQLLGKAPAVAFAKPPPEAAGPEAETPAAAPAPDAAPAPEDATKTLDEYEKPTVDVAMPAPRRRRPQRAPGPSRRRAQKRRSSTAPAPPCAARRATSARAAVARARAR
ncbi:5'-3' exonuclease [Aureococcus anophagefferens]|nr:5'-3' exonuclease [Aureococcus anophagefferens]